MVLNILQTHLRVGGSSYSALQVSVRKKSARDASTFGQHTAARGNGNNGCSGDSSDEDDGGDSDESDMS